MAKQPDTFVLEPTAEELAAAAETLAAETLVAEALAAEALAAEAPVETTNEFKLVQAKVMDLRDPMAVSKDPWLRLGAAPRQVEMTRWLLSQIEAGYAEIVTE